MFVILSVLFVGVPAMLLALIVFYAGWRKQQWASRAKERFEGEWIALVSARPIRLKILISDGGSVFVYDERGHRTMGVVGKNADAVRYEHSEPSERGQLKFVDPDTLCWTTSLYPEDIELMRN